MIQQAADRVGLVIFRESSLVLSPMTLDYQALGDLVGRVNDVNLPDGTAIGVGLSESLNLLRDSKARRSRMNARTISTLTCTALSLRSTVANIATPCSVNA